jgi:hypothetical protein
MYVFICMCVYISIMSHSLTHTYIYIYIFHSLPSSHIYTTTISLKFTHTRTHKTQQSITRKDLDGLTLNVTHDLLWYPSYNGTSPLEGGKGPRKEHQVFPIIYMCVCIIYMYQMYKYNINTQNKNPQKKTTQPGGAYILRPEPNKPAVPINPGPVKLEVVEGAVVTEASLFTNICIR